MPVAAQIASVAVLPFLTAQRPEAKPYVALVPVQLHMGRVPYVDLNGEWRAPIGNISETQTVWDTSLVLSDAQVRGLPRDGGLPYSQYFEGHTLDIAATPEQAQALIALQQEDKKALARFWSILDGAPTFRALVQQAAAQGKLPLEGPGRWVIAPRSPQAYHNETALYPLLGVDRQRRVINLPLRDQRPVGNEFYLFKGGFLMPMSPMCHSVRAMVAALTGADTPDMAAWRGADGRVPPERIAALGAGERGAVDFLSQRIMAELGLPFYRWLSPLPFMEGIDATPQGDAWPVWQPTDAARQAFEAIGGIRAVEEYVDWQDAYLQGQFPIS